MTRPIHIIGGYLGAGKTSLLNRLLRDAHEPLGVIVNDFGAINIDAALLAENTRDDNLIGLNNGCVCCSMRDGLASALEQMRDAEIARVVIEASGVALPGKIRAQCHYPGYHPAGVVVLVDAENHAQTRQDKYVGHLIDEQVEQADLLGITKLDLNPDFSPNFARPALDASEDGFATLLWESVEIANQTSTQPHDPVFATRTLSAPEQTAAKIAIWLEGLPPSAFRAKALGPQGVVHKVGARVEITPTEESDRTGWQIVVLFPAPAAVEIDSYLQLSEFSSPTASSSPINADA